MSSLRRQLSLSLAAGTLLLCLLLYLLVAATVRTLAEGQVASRLEHDAESLLVIVGLDAAGGLRLSGDPHPIYARPFSGHYYRIEAAGQQLLSRSLWDETLPAIDGATAHRVGPRGQPLLLFAKSYTRQELTIRITVAEDLVTLEADLDRFQWRYAALNALLLGSLLLLQRRVLRRGLLPLEATGDDLARLQQGEIATLPERGPDELRPLLQAFNAAHEVTRQRLERSRKALGNLAHALKTPLAGLVQLGDEPALAAHPMLRRRLEQLAARIGQGIDRELQRARIAGYAPPGAALEVATVLQELAATLAQLYRDRAPAITVRAVAGERLRIDPQDLHELLGNLMDNGCKWAKSRLEVGVTSTPERLRITVEDDGPGVPEAALETLVERGRRLDEATAGHGLGLAICADIAAQYGGRLTLARSATLGGLSASVELPPELVSGAVK